VRPRAGAHCSRGHKVAAVLRPRLLVPSFMVAPAPEKPMPETTYAIARTAPSDPRKVVGEIDKSSRPTETRTLVRRPALLCRSCGSARRAEREGAGRSGCRGSREAEIC